MKPLDFKEVANLINHSRVTEINLEPIKHEPGKWALYKGQNKVPHFTYDFFVLYLYADSTRDSVAHAARAITNPKKTQIVYAPSIGLHIKEELPKISKDISGIRNTTEYLSSFIQDQLGAYHDVIISENTPRYFIDPPYETPSGFKKKIPNPLYMFLSDSHPEVDNKEGALGILLAEPGQGKTYTAQYLSSKLCSNNMIPIYVHSPQWVSLSPTDLSSLWKTITHSFRYFETSIDWIQGCEQQFLEVALKAGLFRRIIFDGFDEYILWNRGNVDTNEAVKNLLQLAVSSGCKILITSRTSFWQSEVDESYFSDEQLQPYIYKILPFDRNHAENYFKQRFDEELKLKEALSIYDQLRMLGTGTEASNFAGRGFILSLIADLVADYEDETASFSGKQPVIQWIIRAFCEREVKRQQLPLKAEQQIEVFREFAEYTSCDYKALGYATTTQLLREIITYCADDLRESDIDLLLAETKTTGDIRKLQDHPLIRRGPDGEWDFVHEQIRFALLAEQILGYINKSAEALKNFFLRLRLTGSLQTDLATAIIDRVVNSVSSPVEAKKEIQEIIRALLNCCLSSLERGEESQYERSLAGTIGLLTLNILCRQGQERKDRTEEFISYFPDAALNGISFSGSISSMDFRGVRFKKCRFERNNWANCSFDETTFFDDCHFIGGKVTNCQNFGSAQWLNGHFDLEAKALINSFRIDAGKRQYTKEDLKQDIESLLRKIVPKEGIGFKTVYETHLTAGTIGHSKYRDEITEIVKKHLLHRHELSGISGHAYNVKDSAKDAIKHYFSNGVYSGALSDVYDEVCKRLKL